MSMELDDLLKKEGLDAAGIEDALAWARRRAAELVRDVDGDPELGPLLDGAKVVTAGETAAARAVVPSAASSPAATPKAAPPRPLFTDLRGLQAAILAEGAEDEDAELPEVGAVLRAFQKARSGPTRAATPVPEPTRATPSREGAGEAPAPTPAEASSAPNAEAPIAARDEASTDVGPAARDEASTDVGPTGGAPAPALAETSPATSDEPAPAAAGPDAAHTEAAPATASDEPASADAAPEGAAAPNDDAAAHGVPAPPEADLDPLAGIDFDDLPGVDEDDEEEDRTHIDLPAPGRVAASGDNDLDNRVTMVPVDGPDMTLPSMQAPLAEVTLTMGRIDAVMAPGELTERAPNPLLPADPSGEVTVTAKAPTLPRSASPETVVTADVTAPASVEPAAETADQPAAAGEAEEIELLDDEDLLLVEEEPEEEEVPEWKQALASAQLEREKAKKAAAADDDETDVDVGDD